MKQFRIVLVDGKAVSEWMNCSDWTIEDMKQFMEIPKYYIEYRG